MKQLNVPSLLVLKRHFGISNQLLNCQTVTELISSHICEVELLYKCNITLVDMRYGCKSARCDYLRPMYNHISNLRV